MDGMLKVLVKENFFVWVLMVEELKVVIQFDDFMDFVERLIKVIEKVLDEEYDIFIDYIFQVVNFDDDDE